MKLSPTRDVLRRAAQLLIEANWHPQLVLTLREAGLDPDAPLPNALCTLPLREASGALPAGLLHGLTAIGAAQPTTEGLQALCRQQDVALHSLRGTGRPTIPVDWSAHELLIAGELWRGGLKNSYLSEGGHFGGLLVKRLPLVTALPPWTLEDDRELAAAVLADELPPATGDHRQETARHLAAITGDLDHPALETPAFLDGLADMTSGAGHLASQWHQKGLHVTLRAYWTDWGDEQLTVSQVEATMDGDMTAVLSTEAWLITRQ